MPPKPTAKEPADRARKAILRAAIREFSAHGLAGARTETIAELAKVNKALLYYYFKSKTGLYAAAIEGAAGTVVERTLEGIEPRHSAGERLLRTALNHFDRILTQHEFQSLMQQEMVRFRAGESETMPLLVKKFFEPLMDKLRETVTEGVQSGELVKVDWLQTMYSIFGPNVFYFLSAPMIRLAMQSLSSKKSGSKDPFDPLGAVAIEARRRAVVLFLGNALFVDRTRGARLARRVLADMPMPHIKKDRIAKRYL